MSLNSGTNLSPVIWSSIHGHWRICQCLKIQQGLLTVYLTLVTAVSRSSAWEKRAWVAKRGSPLRLWLDVMGNHSGSFFLSSCRNTHTWRWRHEQTMLSHTGLNCTAPLKCSLIITRALRVMWKRTKGRFSFIYILKDRLEFMQLVLKPLYPKTIDVKILEFRDTRPLNRRVLRK